MAIPDFESIMMPLLTSVKDGTEHRMIDLEEKLATYFQLTENERMELKPSSSHETIFANRTRWARFYLKKAKLLEDPRRSFTKITQRGLDVIKSEPPRIDIKFLMQFPEFVEFYSKKKVPQIQEQKTVIPTQEFEKYTPEDLMIEGYETLNAELERELLDRIISNSPQFFERLVLELIRKMGYGIDHKVLGGSGDGGIDGVIKEDRLGLNEIHFQAKRWKGTIPIHQVRDFGGALIGKKSRRGIFITTSDFSNDAYDYVRNPDVNIVLINGQQLVKLMIEHDVGVQTSEVYRLKKIDEDYFEE